MSAPPPDSPEQIGVAGYYYRAQAIDVAHARLTRTDQPAAQPPAPTPVPPVVIPPTPPAPPPTPMPVPITGGGVLPIPGGTGGTVPTPTPLPVPADDSVLKLVKGRFEIRVRWAHRVTSGWSWGEGAGHAVPRTEQMGEFWFFNSPAYVYLIVMLEDAGPVWWFSAACLVDVEFEITAKDTKTGVVKVYRNPQGSLLVLRDTSAFPEAPDA